MLHTVLRAMMGKEPIGSSRFTVPFILTSLTLMILLHSCAASAQDRIVTRDGRVQGYVERPAAGSSTSRIIGRDGLTRGYVDGSSGRIIGRDGRTQGYVVPERRR